MSNLIEIALINAALATVLAVIVWLITRVVCNPALVHALWVIVLLKLVTPPFISIPWSYAQRSVPTPATSQPSTAIAATPISFAAVSTDASTSLPGSASLAVASPDVSATRFGEANSPTTESDLGEGKTAPLQSTGARPTFSPSTIAKVWLAGSAIWLLLSTLRVTRFHRALAHTIPASQELCELADKVAARLGVAHRFRLRITEGRLPPLVWPIGRPTIVLSRPLVAELSPEETQTLLAHEFAHLRRKDHWVRWLEMAVTALYWWHPVVWLARAIIRNTEERACDAWVVWAFPDAAKRYASALFTAVQFVSDSASAPPLVASRLSTGGNLKERIENVMSGNCDRRLSFLHKMSVLVLALLILPLTLRAVRAADEPATSDAALSFPTEPGINTTSTAAPYTPRSSKLENEIERQLQTPVKLQYTELPLAEVMDQLGNSVGVDIHFDSTSLDKEGISVDVPVTITLKNRVSLRSALNLILKPLHLTFVIEDEVLKITNERHPVMPALQTYAAVDEKAASNPFALASTPPSTSAATAATSEELNALREHVKFLHAHFERVDARFKAGQPGGSADVRDMVGYEMATAEGALAQAEGRIDEAAENLDKAKKFAEQALKSVTASYEAGRVTNDLVLQAASNLTESKHRLNQLRAKSASTVGLPQSISSDQVNRGAATPAPASDARLSIGVMKKIVEGRKQYYDRMRALSDKNVVSTAELEKAKNEYDTNVARYEQAMRALKYNQLLVKLAEIEYQEALTKNLDEPKAVSNFEIEKLKIKLELAKAQLSELEE